MSQSNSANEEETVSDQKFVSVAFVPDEKLMPSAHLRKLVASLGLFPDEQNRFVGHLRKLSAHYLVHKEAEARYADHATSRALMNIVAKRAAEVANALRRMRPDLLVAIENDRYGLLPSSNCRARLPAADLVTELEQLAVSAGDVHARTPPRDNHRAENALLKITIGDLIWSLEEGGFVVQPSTSKDSVARRHLSGPGGEFIVKFFKLLDPSISEATLFRVAKELRPLTLKSIKSQNRST